MMNVKKFESYASPAHVPDLNNPPAQICLTENLFSAMPDLPAQKLIGWCFKTTFMRWSEGFEFACTSPHPVYKAAWKILVKYVIIHMKNFLPQSEIPQKILFAANKQGGWKFCQNWQVTPTQLIQCCFAQIPYILDAEWIVWCQYLSKQLNHSPLNLMCRVSQKLEAFKKLWQIWLNEIVAIPIVPYVRNSQNIFLAYERTSWRKEGFVFLYPSNG